MDELEERINSVLSDTQQMEKITRLAQSIMAGGSQNTENAAVSDMGIDMNMLSRISRLMNAGNDRDKNERTLLEAMTPYLSERRRGKMERALKIAKLARLARIAIEESEGDA